MLTPTMSAGYARAQKLIVEADRASRAYSEDRRDALSHQVGWLQGVVRNLCAELAAYEPEDGSVEIEWNGERLWVHLGAELIQVNGFDISRLLSKADKAAVLTIAQEAQREQRDGAAFHERYAV